MCLILINSYLGTTRRNRRPTIVTHLDIKLDVFYVWFLVLDQLNQ